MKYAPQEITTDIGNDGLQASRIQQNPISPFLYELAIEKLSAFKKQKNQSPPKKLLWTRSGNLLDFLNQRQPLVQLILFIHTTYP
jgi:hypothetical protein